MDNYPILFQSESKSESSASMKWEVEASLNKSSCSIPPEFSGPGGAFSPEDFYLLALSNCFIATFKVFATNSKLEYQAIKVTSKLSVEKVESGQTMAKGCQFAVYLDGIENSARAIAILKKVAKVGILLNSVKSELRFDYFINGQTVQ